MVAAEVWAKTMQVGNAINRTIAVANLANERRLISTPLTMLRSSRIELTNPKNVTGVQASRAYGGLLKQPYKHKASRPGFRSFWPIRSFIKRVPPTAVSAKC